MAWKWHSCAVFAGVLVETIDGVSICVYYQRFITDVTVVCILVIYPILCRHLDRFDIVYGIFDFGFFSFADTLSSVG